MFVAWLLWPLWLMARGPGSDAVAMGEIVLPSFDWDQLCPGAIIVFDGQLLEVSSFDRRHGLEASIIHAAGVDDEPVTMVAVRRLAAWGWQLIRPGLLL